MSVGGAPGAGTKARETVGVRASRESDLPALHAIYAHHVLNGLASFELEPPDREAFARRREALLAEGLPYLVAEVEGRIAGFAYCGPYRPRPAYRHTVENSVYTAPGLERRGVGRALITALIEQAAAAGYRQMVAIIGDSGNEASIALHEALGFRRVGTLESIGYKFGRWVDTVIMQRALGPGDGQPPAR